MIEKGEAPTEATLLPAPSPTRPRGRMDAIDSVRFLVQIHIVAYHFLAAAWGQTWVPFFFLVSGFGATHSHLQRHGFDGAEASCSALLPRPSTLVRRLAGVYPTFAFSILLSFVAEATVSPQSYRDAVRPSVLVAQLLLVETWIPRALWYPTHATHRTPPSVPEPDWYNIPSWYVSALAFYWLLEPLAIACASALYRTPQRFGGLWGTTLLWLLLTILWVAAWPFALCPLTWGGLDVEWTWVIALAYVHIFVCGACLAALLHARALAGCAPTRCAASLATVVLVPLLLTPAAWLPPNFISLWCKRVGLLTPLHALLVLGLAEGADPLATHLLARWPLPQLKDLALGIYLLQEPTWALLRGPALSLGWARPFNHLSYGAGPFFVLLAAIIALAALVHVAVQRPLGKAIVGLLGCCGAAPVPGAAGDPAQSAAPATKNI